MSTDSQTSRAVCVDEVELELSPADRVHSPGDVLRLLSGLVVLVVGVALAFWAGGTIGGAEADLARGLSRIPSRWERVVLGVAEVMAATASVAIAVALAISRRRRLLAWLAATVISASAITFGLDWLLAKNRVEVLAGVDTAGEWFLANPAFPSSGFLAGLTAALVFGSPWLTSRWRHVGWFTLAALILLRMGFSSDPSADVAAAIGVGIVIGAAMLLWRGAPSLEPSANQLVESLRSAGIMPRRIVQLTAVHSTLSYQVECVDGTAVHLGLRTQHDRSADVLTHMWQTLRLRADEVDEPFNTIRQKVEHEALALEMAGRSGARVPGLVGLVSSGEEAIGIAETDVGDVVAEEQADLGEELLVDIWTQVAQLHRARIAHRYLSLRRVHIDSSGSPWLTDFQRSRLVATERERALDIAQLLTDTAMAVGPERAVQACLKAMGTEVLARSVPLLQPLALPRATRIALREHDDLLRELRELVAQRCGLDEAPLERIERVRPRTVMTVVALTLAFYLILPQLADIRSTANAFTQGDWAWAPWIIVGSALSYVFAAVAFVGAVPHTVPFVPALRAQVASSFVGLIAPGSSGTLALGVRFLQRSGVQAAPAAAAAGLNTIAGLVVHLSMMVAFVIWNGSSDLGAFSFPDSTLLLGGVALVLAAAGLLMLHRGIRERVAGPVARAARSAASSIGEVLTNPLRVLQLLGGSIGITLSYILAMVAAAEAFGGGPSVTQVAVGYLVAAGLASVAPTPGGLGAFEAAMITALTGFGMASGAAVSATLSFRLATYWLPVLPGWFTFTWMQHHEEL